MVSPEEVVRSTVFFVFILSPKCWRTNTYLLLTRRDAFPCCRYMDFFPVVNSTSTQFLFEKSATYFDGESVPKRAHALLPSAKLVIILLRASMLFCFRIKLVYSTRSWSFASRFTGIFRHDLYFLGFRDYQRKALITELRLRFLSDFDGIKLISKDPSYFVDNKIRVWFACINWGLKKY